MPNMAPLTQDEQCILLQTVEPGGKLVEVASGLVMASRVMHGARLAEDVAKVKLVMVVPEYRYAMPPLSTSGHRRRRRFAPWGLHLMGYEMAEEPDSSGGSSEC